MRKKFLCTIFSLTIIGSLLAGCGKTEDSSASNVQDTVSNTATETPAQTENTTEETSTEASTKTTTDEASSDLSFEDLAKYYYEFSSGAGGWGTDLDIEKDGYFHGNYHDSEMGDIGDDYPDGSIYVCSFSGHFTDLTKIDDYTYEMTLSDIKYDNEVDTEEITDGIRYVYTDAFGLTDAEKLLVYLPGKKISDIDESVYSWLDMWNESDTELELVAIVNGDQAFGSFERDTPANEAQLLYDSYSSTNDYYLDKLNKCTTTLEMVECENSRYTQADECLNELWSILKYNADEDTYNTVLTEQREWLTQRDEGAAAYDSEDAGTLAAVDKADYLATQTMDRCQQLLEIIKDL